MQMSARNTHTVWSKEPQRTPSLQSSPRETGTLPALFIREYLATEPFQAWCLKLDAFPAAFSEYNLDPSNEKYQLSFIVINRVIISIASDIKV